MTLMLWFCGTDAPVADRVSRAAEYYQSKYGRPATICLLPMSEEIAGSPEGISLERQPNVLEGHLILGVA